MHTACTIIIVINVIALFMPYLSFSRNMVLILTNTPALINAPQLFSDNNVILYEFLFVSLDEVLFEMGSTLNPKSAKQKLQQMTF